MYFEIKEFVSEGLSDRILWKDGEFWTALAVGSCVGLWCHLDATAIPGIRAHLGDLLSVTSIVFGFVLTTLFFYVQTAGTWAHDIKVNRVAERLVNWLVWTIFCLLFQVGYIMVLWALAKTDAWPMSGLSVSYGILGFLVSYSGFQMLNHTLTVRWIFRKRHHLQTGRPPKASVDDVKEESGDEHMEGRL